MSPIDRDDDALPLELSRAADLLREEVPVPPGFRDTLVAAMTHPLAPRGGVYMTGGFAIAAAVTLLLLGGAAGAWIGTSGARTAAPPLAVAGGSGPVVQFLYVAPSARRVSVVGDFNGWNPESIPLKRLADGRTWIGEVHLAPGRYAYSFFVDGALRADPTAAHPADDDFGVANSVLVVRGS